MMIFDMKTEITYTLHGTRDGNHWFQLGKELKSKKLVLGALKKRAYPPKFSEFSELKWVKNVKTIESTEETFVEYE